MTIEYYDCPHKEDCESYKESLDSNVPCPKPIEISTDAGSFEITYRCIPLDLAGRRATVINIGPDTNTNSEVDCDYLGNFAYFRVR